MTDGLRVRALRHRLCLSQDELAARAKVSKQTIWRAERGDTLNPSTVRALCEYLEQTPETLGLAVRGGARQEPWVATRETEGMRRRDLLGLMNVASAALVWPTLPSVDWARMDSALAETNPVDERVLQDLAALNRNLWQALWPALRPEMLLDQALELFRRLSRLLPAARTADHHRRLCSLLAEASHLLGVIFLDSDHDDAAATGFTFAASAAKEAGDYDLWAGALVRHAWIPVFNDRPDQALPFLYTAAQLAQRGDSTLPTRYWVAAVAADACAGVGDFAGLTRQCSEMFLKTLRSLDTELVPFEQVPAVKEFRTQIRIAA